jgi:glyceraldehyde 3-phosphate dehydrogenase
MARIAINGLGRIGRAFLKLALTRPELDVVAVNELGDPDALAYLLRFDSAYGRYSQAVSVDSAHKEIVLIVGGRRILFIREANPVKLPWAALNVDIVVEATGAFEHYEQARAHLAAGARRVVLTAPAKDDDGPDARTILVGINGDEFRDISLYRTVPARRIQSHPSSRHFRTPSGFGRHSSTRYTRTPRHKV